MSNRKIDNYKIIKTKVLIKIRLNQLMKIVRTRTIYKNKTYKKNKKLIRIRMKAK